MRIGIVVPYFTPFVRGNEFGLADGLARLGEDVTVITSMSKAPREKAVKSDYKMSPEERFKVKYLWTPLDIGELPLTPGVIPEVLSGRYDVLLLQEDYQPVCHMACFAAKLKGIPTVLSTERTYFPAGLKKLALKLFDLTVNSVTRRLVTAYTAHCTTAKSFVENELRVSTGRVQVVHVGVDAGLFKPTTGHTPLADGGFKILTVARLTDYKGLDHLIRAMAIVKRRQPQVVSYIMGRGHLAADLKELAVREGVADVVRFVETPVPNYEMPAVYSSADLYVQPSIIEPYGIAVLEAMACGKPTVCSKVGGMMDTVADGRTGFLVPAGDANELAEKIVMLAADSGKMNTMGAAARARVEAEFDWPVIARQYVEIVRGLDQ